MPGRTSTYKVLRNEAFNIAKNFNYGWYQRELASLAYKYFNKKYSGSGSISEIMQNYELAEELHKPIIKQFENRKVYSFFRGNI